MSRITIIPSDAFCSVDGVGYHGVDMSSMPNNIHAVQWIEVDGWIEFKETLAGKPANEIIDNMDQFQLVLDSWAKIDFEHNHPTPPEPTPPTAEENKKKASALLAETDWTQLPSVSDPAQSNPYLTNAAEFAAYRSQLREIAVNPVAGFINWPIKPEAVWSQA